MSALRDSQAEAMVEEHGLQLVVASSMRRTLATATGAFSSDVPMIGEKRSNRLRFLSCVCPEPVLARQSIVRHISRVKSKTPLCLTSLLSDGRAA